MALYSTTVVDNLAQRYLDRGGDILVLREGSLVSYGEAVFYGEGLKTTIVKEVYINGWSSGCSIRKYNKTPKKYTSLLA